MKKAEFVQVSSSPTTDFSMKNAKNDAGNNEVGGTVNALEANGASV